jgi:phosphoglycerate kinase
MDIGEKSVLSFEKMIMSARTIVWNGPMGVFEMKPFSGGTRGVMRLMVEATKRGASTIIGGGDTATAAIEFGAESQVTHVSTGGGASLELLEGQKLVL